MHGPIFPHSAPPDSAHGGGSFRPAGFVVGLKAEARILRGCGCVAIGGGMPAGAEAAAEALARAGAGALVSVGLAGGLDPALRPGDVVIPAAIWAEGSRLAADPALCALLGGPNADRLAAAPGPVATSTAKAELFRRSGAVAADLESGAVALVAARHGLPFAALRVICDPAARDLPPAALAALDAEGAIGVWRVALAVLRRPSQIPALLRLAADAAAARQALRAAAARLRLVR